MGRWEGEGEKESKKSSSSSSPPLQDLDAQSLTSAGHVRAAVDAVSDESSAALSLMAQQISQSLVLKAGMYEQGESLT